jgi:hypothetical protein
LPGLASNCNPPTSASYVSKIIGVSHHPPSSLDSL